MTADILLKIMKNRYRNIPLLFKMPDSPEMSIKSQVNSSSTISSASLNGNISPQPSPSPPLSSPPISHRNSDMSAGNSVSKNRHVSMVKRFLATLQQFAFGIPGDAGAGERAHSLIMALVSSSISIEDFHQKIQEITNYPLKPFAINFLKTHLPVLQAELVHCSRTAKQTPQQYLKQHEHYIMDSNPHPEPFEIFQSSRDVKEGGKRRISTCRNGKIDIDYSDSNGDCPHPAKRHHSGPSLGSSSPVSNPGIGLLQGLNLRLPDEGLHGYRDGRMDRYERFERDFFRPYYGNLSREFAEDRDMEEEWRNIHTMLSCILGMVEKTKRALNILQHRSYSSERGGSDINPAWIRHSPEHHKKSGIMSHFKMAEDRVSEVRRRAEEAVQEVKRQAVAELQKAVSAAECKAGELVAAERLKMERLLHETRRQATEDASRQEESTENCWNCGRKASENCSGCNLARYCGSFCQHKDWDTHQRVCSQTSTSEENTPPSTTSDCPSPDKAVLVDIKPVI